MTRRVRSLTAFATAAILAGGTAFVSLSTAQAGTGGLSAGGHQAGRATSARQPSLSAAARSILASPASTGGSDVTDLGANGWEVQSSKVATQTGAQISTPGFNTSSWLPVTNDDAGAPGTEVEALAENGQCPGDTALQPVNLSTDSPDSVYYSSNMKSCYGYMSTIGADTVAEFDVPWWWRTDFTPNLAAGQYGTLIVNGVIGSANVWVNGQEVATSATVTGAYTKFTFNITSLIVSGTNSLAIEINPNDPLTMFTLDDVDWNQIPPDNNTGIQFPVQLAVDGALTDNDARVVENNAANLSSSALTVKTDITNNTATSQTGTVSATITPPGTGTPITVSQNVTVPASTTQTVSFAPSTFPSLTISGPQIWWPYQLGAQPLYTLATSVAQNGTTLNSTSETFGIRTVTSYLTGSNSGEPQGARAFKINGVPIVIRGGGFSPDIFLHYSSADIARQIALMKNMGINTIRLEGHLMPPDFYEQMDAAGMLVNAGFQCCDAWELESSGLTTSADYAIMQNSAAAIAQTIRDHPSVFSFQWSDLNPTTEQESVTLTAFANEDMDDPVISSAEYNSSTQLGISGEKEGPYDWVPPSYWYDTTHFDKKDNTQTNAGGSWGYDSEQSAGDTIPTMDSLNRFMTATDESNLLSSSVNQYHANYETACNNNYSFGTLCHFNAALDARYGTPATVAQYVEKAQVQDYEDTRAQFEAFIDHASNTPMPSTGTIYWQMNKGWPSLLWSLYGYDGDQPGAYFGVQEANKPLHALYSLDNGTVTLDNLGATTESGLTVEAKVYNLAGTVTNDQTSAVETLASQQVLGNVLTPVVPTTPAGTTYFVELLLKQNGTLVDRNVYWLSTTQDAVNWSKSLDKPAGVISAYANLTGLNRLPASTIAATATSAQQAGPDGADLATTVTITNTSSSTVAFFLRADVRRGTATGSLQSGDNELQSSIWQGNDITLFPGESQTLPVTYDSSDLNGATPVITVSGWNVPQVNIPAPVP
jgi:exo-1,4-beta-D-glucosaminidase